MKRFFPDLRILLSILVFCTPLVSAQDGLGGALPHSPMATVSLPGFGPQTVAADFDQDQRPDGAILTRIPTLNGRDCYQIEVHLTAGRNQVIAVSLVGAGLAIKVSDINRDGAPDLIIRKALTDKLLKVYLNNGHGHFYGANSANYTLPKSPSTFWGQKLTQEMPVLSLPPTRGIDGICLKRNFIFAVDRFGRLSLALESDRTQSVCTRRSSPRAPPTFLSL